MKHIQNIQILDLQGNDIRKGIIKENSLAPDFLEKHLGNFIYTQGSDKVYELGRMIYQGEPIEISIEDNDELSDLIKKAFEGFPPIVARSLIANLIG